ncbi:MAG: SPW repeat protein [Candidatus Liptonbacteria bacterium]|nr:SPW repeat protein [Candidatus Liptonbacteria bacterium]
MSSAWTGLAIGVWLIISPWLLAFSEISPAKWSSVFTGLILTIVFAWEIFGEKEEEKNK